MTLVPSSIVRQIEFQGDTTRKMLNELRDRTKVILCEACGRILYLTAKPEAVKPGPGAEE